MAKKKVSRRNARPATRKHFALAPSPPAVTSRWFMIRFIALAGMGYLLLELAPESFYHPVNRVNALMLHALLATLGLSAGIRDVFVDLQGFRVQVVGECSAVFVAVLPVSFMLAFPAAWCRRGIGIAAALAGLTLLNLVRLVGVVATGAWRPGWFPYVHLFCGQILMVAGVMVTCAVWLRWLQKPAVTGPMLRRAGIAAGAALGFFVLWLALCRPFTRLLLTVAAGILSVGNAEVTLPADLGLYPDTFISFNLVLFGVLVVTAPHLPPLLRIRRAAWGLALLTLLNLLFHLLRLAFFQLGITQTYWLINALLILNQWLAPFILWLALPGGGKPSGRINTEQSKDLLTY